MGQRSGLNRLRRIFETGDIIRVPYPYVEVARREVRPALVISRAALGLDASVVWAIMITSAANRGWPGDIDLTADFADFGLPIASVIRCAKISTVMVSQASLVGRLSGAKLDAVWAGACKFAQVSDIVIIPKLKFASLNCPSPRIGRAISTSLDH